MNPCWTNVFPVKWPGGPKGRMCAYFIKIVYSYYLGNCSGNCFGIFIEGGQLDLEF